MSHPLPPGRRRVYLVRHGAVSYFDDAGRPLDPRDVALTEMGRAQAAALGRVLSAVPLDRAVCSAMPRTRETAEGILAGRDLPIADEPRLREIRAGRFRDVPPDLREPMIARAYDNAGVADARFIGGEPFADFRDRVRAAWADLVAGGPWAHLLLVAHDAVNRVLLAQAAGLDLAAMPRLEQDMGCLNVIDLDVTAGGRVGRSFVKALNVTPLDPAKAGLGLTSMEAVHRAYRPENF